VSRMQRVVGETSRARKGASADCMFIAGELELSYSLAQNDRWNCLGTGSGGNMGSR
jgi:hypothetical protein